MNVKQQLLQLSGTREKLHAAIDKESWDTASQFTQQWDQSVRSLFDCLSSDQFDVYKTEIKDLVEQNRIVTEQLTLVRAKSLTQLQEFNELRTANKYYNETI